MRMFQAVGLTLALATIGCNSGDNSSSTGSEPQPKPIAAEAAKAPLEAPAPATMRSVESTPEMVSHGKELFVQCAACHGEDAKGKTGMGPALNSDSFLAAAADEFLFNTIKNGREGTTMIQWGAIMKDEDIHSLIAYLRSINPVEPVELNEAPLKGDPAEGGKIFGSICAACHGRSGGGYQETANGTGIGRAAFIKVASNGYLRYIIRNGKDQTKMRGFDENDKVAVANLNDQQIENVIAYLRTSAW